MRQAPSPNHDARPEGVLIDMLLLHYTGMPTAAEAVARLRDPASRVSSHYVVEEDGLVWQLVAEERRAWHAGISHWRGYSGLNDRTVGIEIVNPGHQWGYRPFPALQMAAVCDLCLSVLERHPILARNVVAHSDVAPDRKDDPGELFDWRGLAANGVGLWPTQDAEPAVNVMAALGAIGYRTDLPQDVLLRAFQRHWRPGRVDGLADRETRSRLSGVSACIAQAQDSP